MRTHTKLTPAQIAANAAFASVPPAVRRAAHGTTQADRLQILREQPKAGRGGLSLQVAELLSRDIWPALAEARGSSPRRGKKPVAMEVTTPAYRLAIKRRDLAASAAKNDLRIGSHYEIHVRVAAEGEEPAYTITRDRRWQGRNAKWGTDWWIHRIRLPQGWMASVRNVGRRAGYLGEGQIGSLNDGRMVMTCEHLQDVYFDSSSYSSIYEAQAVHQGRGMEVSLERVYVRVWPTGRETYHSNLRRAISAKAPEAVVRERDKIEREELRRYVAQREDMKALDMELC